MRVGTWPFILRGVMLHENRWEFEFVRCGEEQWWHKTPKTSKITKKHNGHTWGKFVLIILHKKLGYFQVFSVVNERYFIPHTTTGTPSSRLEKAKILLSIYSYKRHGCASWNGTYTKHGPGSMDPVHGPPLIFNRKSPLLIWKFTGGQGMNKNTDSYQEPW